MTVRDRRAGKLLVDLRGVGLGGVGLLAVARLEAGDAATSVQDLLLAGVERVALRAHVRGDLAALHGAAGLERVATGAGDRGRDVGGVKVLLQRVLLVFGAVPDRVRGNASHAGTGCQHISVPDQARMPKTLPEDEPFRSEEHTSE